VTEGLETFWSLSAERLLEELASRPQGLSEGEARERLSQYGPNLLRPRKQLRTLGLLLSQFKSPIILILIFAASLSFFLRDSTNAIIILAIVLISGLLAFWQEKGAAHAMEKLLAMVQIKVAVRRDRETREIPVEAVVPGDILLLNAGDVIAGDALLLESKDLFVDEAALTGETFPAEKTAGAVPPDAGLSQRKNSLFMGTHVVSGTAAALVVLTGKNTVFGEVAERLRLKAPETEFEHGVRRFGYFLMEVTLLLVVTIFAINVYLARPVMDSFLFAVALAVGLTPQLLPAIISINLATGAKRMAQEKVIVKRLAAIENFGSMDVLCSDKTGTLTQGEVQIHSALTLDGADSGKVLFYAYLNAIHETGFANPVDEAIRRHCCPDVAGYQKLDEVPYDFIRKRLSILVAKDGASLMVTKGALQRVLEVCSSVEMAQGEVVPLSGVQDQIQRQYQELSQKGLRTLGVAYRGLEAAQSIDKTSETDMTFLGFLALYDPPKPGIAATIARMRKLGVTLKIITGDNHLVAASIAAQVGVAKARVLAGTELARMSDEALLHKVGRTQVFAEVEPNQKERIILALRKAGHVVGYMGDGINDASALHAADVSLSVDSAVDVAKEAADIVLLEKDLEVLIQGVQEGRKTFANTLKYVFMATSANFGNMFSMAGASLFLPFLPLLPKQILLTNLLTDFPEMTIATDEVDPELVDRPHRWNIGFIRKFMLVFGILSSVFDYLTFGALLIVLKATPELFRTGWFLESVLSATAIVLVIRSRRPFFRSRPGVYLVAASCMIFGVTLVLPFSPLAGLFNFQPLPREFLLLVGVILLLYMGAAELAKRVFYARIKL
jgi:Mg2+-importing ATPase